MVVCLQGGLWEGRNLCFHLRTLESLNCWVIDLVLHHLLGIFNNRMEGLVALSVLGSSFSVFPLLCQWDWVYCNFQLCPHVCEVGILCLGIYCYPTSYIPIIIKVLIFHSCLYLSIHRPLSIMGKRRSPHLATKGK